jgi:SAM-dependent methyltransferase
MLAIEEVARLGIHAPLKDWLELNLHGAFSSPENLSLIAPFPPRELMQNTTGATDPRVFAHHSYTILEALTAANPKPWDQFNDILDFGVGVGRVARMFKGFRGRYTGVDIDARHVAWVSSALTYVRAVTTFPKQSLPFGWNSFDGVISVSVFTHMTEKDHFFYLLELARVTRTGSVLLLTTHGTRALERAEKEEDIFNMLSVPRAETKKARDVLSSTGFHFILQQQGHLTTAGYKYGITFISENYIRQRWSAFFDVVHIVAGGLHDFQDIVVLTRK